MVNLFLFLSFMVVIPCSASMRSVKKTGKEWAQSSSSFALNQGKKVDIQELTTIDLNTHAFDAKEAKRNIENQTLPQSETVDFLTSPQVQNNQLKKNFHQEEFFIKNSEEIFATKGQPLLSDLEKKLGYTYHTCQRSGDPFLVSTTRTLNVQLNLLPKEQVNVCLGHKKNVLVKKTGNFEESVKKLKKKYQKDSTIQPDSIQIICLHAHPSPTHYLAQVSYCHLNNTESCHKCRKKSKKQEDYAQVETEWMYDNLELWNLSQSIESTILEHSCLDANSTKRIHGHPINRQCWQEKISFLYRFPSTNDCNILKQKNCEQIKQECSQFNSSHCVQWQLTFRCLDTINPTYQLESFELEDEESIAYTPNQSFSEVAAKLTVFAEVKKEMEQSNEFDVTKLEIFKGKRMSCSKNVADHLMYDCCFSYAGLAKQMNLTKCTADEIGLAEMREHGLCHYVGSYEEKMLDLWKSRDEHVFCCFPSKLSRIVQEEGHKQLGRSWGEAKEPNCKGFTTDELSQLNFSKMDLSEICDTFVKKLPEDIPQRLQAFQNRLQQEIDQMEIKK